VEIADALGPKAFPALLGIGLVLSALLLFLETRRAGEKVQEKEEVLEEKGQLFLIGGVTLWSLIFFTILETLGFLLSCALYTFVLILLQSESVVIKCYRVGGRYYS
jgi:putative tricarboxylic transport membrane protein